jgi:integrase
MSSITKTSRSRFWMASFRDATGKQYARSTRIEHTPAGTDPRERARLASENKRKAQAVAHTFERAARGELTRETAIRETLLELIEMAGGPRIEEKTAMGFFHEWLAGSELVGKGETTLKRYRQVAKDFLEHLGDKARAPIAHITPHDVQNFVNDLTAKGRATKTVSNCLKILRIPFAEGCRMGAITFNPARAVKPPAVVSIEREAFTAEEIRAILAACEGVPHGEQWRTAVHLGYYAAMRLGDATGLSWGNIDFARRMICFTPEKTKGKGRKVEIPLHPALEGHLATLTPSLDPTAKLTPDLEQDAGTRCNLSRSFSRIMIAAGVASPKQKAAGGRGRSVSTKSFHALRHTLTSHLAAAGVSPEVRMKITGHTDTRTHAGYTHHETENLRAALAKVATA